MSRYFSQCGEDKFLNDNYFKNKINGTFIELGALDGITYANTKFFEDTLKWTGILIEPHPLKFAELKKNRPNCHLFNELISSKKDELEFKYFLNQHAAVSGVLSTLPESHFPIYYNNPKHAKLKQNSIKLVPKTLSEIVKSVDINHFDLLSLDVEGHELEVLKSWDFSIPIDVILVETLGTIRDDLVRNILLENGYIFDQKYKHNEIFILKTFKK